MGVEAAAEVPAAAELYAKASEILGYDLLELCKEGPKEELDTTVKSQPAIFVASMAAVEKLRASGEEGAAAIEAANVACGLSLGEYTALAFAGAISFEDGVKITKARGEAMQAASEAASSGMVSVIGLDAEKVQELCAAAAEETGKPIAIANYLCPGNYACSGAMEAVEAVCAKAKPDFKARMAVKLAVAGAFHTDFMAPAVPELDKVRRCSTKRTARVLSLVDLATPHMPAVDGMSPATRELNPRVKALLLDGSGPARLFGGVNSSIMGLSQRLPIRPLTLLTFSRFFRASPSPNRVSRSSPMSTPRPTRTLRRSRRSSRRSCVHAT